MDSAERLQKAVPEFLGGGVGEGLGLQHWLLRNCSTVISYTNRIPISSTLVPTLTKTLFLTLTKELEFSCPNPNRTLSMILKPGATLSPEQMAPKGCSFVHSKTNILFHFSGVFSVALCFYFSCVFSSTFLLVVDVFVFSGRLRLATESYKT